MSNKDKSTAQSLETHGDGGCIDILFIPTFSCCMPTLCPGGGGANGPGCCCPGAGGGANPPPLGGGGANPPLLGGGGGANPPPAPGGGGAKPPPTPGGGGANPPPAPGGGGANPPPAPGGGGNLFGGGGKLDIIFYSICNHGRTLLVGTLFLNKILLLIRSIVSVNLFLSLDNACTDQ